MLLFWYAPLIFSLTQPTLIEAGVLGKRIAEAPVADTFRYENLGIEVPIEKAAWTSPLNTKDWRKIRSALERGVSLAYEGEFLESVTLAFITGHSSDVYPHRYSSVFASLGQAQRDDNFTLWLNQNPYQFKVTGVKIISPQDVEEFQALNPGEKSDIQRVALVTCWPVLTTRSRLVVIGERSLRGSL
ncbi:sortase [Candidatus Berkelbacteria bacterium]|nr:sortase [Candidatus Berkelbacteria bacterium]